MRKILNVFLIGVLFFNLSCLNNPQRGVIKIRDFNVQKNGKSYLINTLYSDDEQMFAMVNYDSVQIYFLKYPNLKQLKSISLKSTFSQDAFQSIAPYQILIYNQDSIFIGLSSNEVLLVNGEGKLENSWNLNQVPDNEIELVFLPFAKMYRKNSRLFLANASASYVGDQEGRKDYFSRVQPCLILDLITGQLMYPKIKFPEVYQSGLNYQSFHMSQCIVRDYELYSFALSPEIMVFKNGKFEKSVECKSKYWTEPDVFPDDSIQNYYYRKKYNRSQTRYDRIVFDTYRKLYYRLVNIASEFEKNDGTLKELNNWSCIIMDEQFTIKEEVFFNSDDYYSYYFLPVPDGILIGDSKESRKNNNSVCLDLIQFQNEE